MNDDDRSTSLGEFLVGLGENFEALKAFLENPERTMSEAGVSASDRDLVLKGNVEEIHNAIREQFGDATVACIVHPLIVWW